MKNSKFWENWLLFTTYLVLIVGLIMMLIGFLPARPLQDPFLRGLWEGRSLDAGTYSFYSWTFGVWGATIAGWGMSMVFLVKNAYRKREKWAWNAIFSAALIWFVFDTFFSLKFNIMLNVALNLFLFVLILLPLLMMRKEFKNN